MAPTSARASGDLPAPDGSMIATHLPFSTLNVRRLGTAARAARHRVATTSCPTSTLPVDSSRRMRGLRDTWRFAMARKPPSARLAST